MLLAKERCKGPRTSVAAERPDLEGQRVPQALSSPTNLRGSFWVQQMLAPDIPPPFFAGNALVSRDLQMQYFSLTRPVVLVVFTVF
jgi:hypothetical protein